MGRVSRWASRVAPLFLAVFLVLTAVRAWAGEPPPTDPPQARMQPPVGVTTQARVAPPVGIAPPPPPDVTQQARIQPPGGMTAQARLGPPGGAPMTLREMILMWLQSRISIPNG
jgi:hypothetical protein